MPLLNLDAEPHGWRVWLSAARPCRLIGRDRSVLSLYNVADLAGVAE
jgi:hypothetical protein